MMISSEEYLRIEIEIRATYFQASYNLYTTSLFTNIIADTKKYIFEIHTLFEERNMI